MDSIISIPLALLRKWLYIVVIVFPLVFIILPFSILSYLNFYNVIIPSSITSSPVKFQYEGGFKSSTVDLDALSTKFDDLSNYVLLLDLGVVCERNMNDVMMVKYTLDELNIKDTLTLNCDHKYVYGKNNWFIPYNLRLWVPPVITNLERVNRVSIYLTQATGLKLNELKNINIKLDRNLAIDNRLTRFITYIQLEGFRYYMVHYSITSFIIGVGFFWLLSSSVCVITSLLIWLTYTNTKKSKFD